MRQTKEVLRALNDHLVGMAGGYKIAFPGTEFTPPQNSIWLKADYLMAKPVMIGAFTQGMYREQGIYQVTVFGPKGRGALDIVEATDVVMDRFQRGTELTGIGPTVKIERCYRSSPMEESPWTKVPVSIEFWWYTPYRS